ncbi:MAG: DUF2949 domain-containing protein [Cyanobacteria bacterium P01_H01_bin.58]
MSQQAKLIEFLKQELSIPAEAIALGLKHSEASPSLLPMVLWQYGLVSTYQLSQIFDWLEASV